MKIKVSDYRDIEGLSKQDVTEIEVQSRDVELEDVFCGVGIQTDQGYFGICQRDSGIEVLLDGKLVWSSSEIDR